MRWCHSRARDSPRACASLRPAERARGLEPEQAIFDACLERFRPILMTTLAAMLGACSQMGPQVLMTGRPQYNIAVQQTEAQQLLLNIVRNRYMHHHLSWQWLVPRSPLPLPGG